MYVLCIYIERKAIKTNSGFKKIYISKTFTECALHLLKRMTVNAKLRQFTLFIFAVNNNSSNAVPNRRPDTTIQESEESKRRRVCVSITILNEVHLLLD